MNGGRTNGHPASESSHAVGVARSLVVQDPHRPGREHGRLVDDEIPVWAIIQHMTAIGDVADPIEAREELIAQTAADYAISETAVRAALTYYAENRAAIDTKIASNAAGTAA